MNRHLSNKEKEWLKNIGTDAQPDINRYQKTAIYNPFHTRRLVKIGSLIILSAEKDMDKEECKVVNHLKK